MRKDTTAPWLFDFFLFCVWAKSIFRAGSALSHASWLGAALYKMTPAVGESSPLPHSLAPQPLAVLLFLLSETFAKN